MRQRVICPSCHHSTDITYRSKCIHCGQYIERSSVDNRYYSAYPSVEELIRENQLKCEVEQEPNRLAEHKTNQEMDNTSGEECEDDSLGIIGIILLIFLYWIFK